MFQGIRGRRPLGRSRLLGALALSASAVSSACHGGQGDEPAHPPVQDTYQQAMNKPDDVPANIVAVREYPLPAGAQPDIVFRASAPGLALPAPTTGPVRPAGAEGRTR